MTEEVVVPLSRKVDQNKTKDNHPQKEQQQQQPDSVGTSFVLKHDNEDDGEQGAGSRLAQLLHMRQEDGVLVVVSRWYGGTPLGPKRFAHITNAARQALEMRTTTTEGNEPETLYKKK